MPIVQKWGNGLAIRIPTRVVEQLSVKAGTRLEIRPENGSLVITPHESRSRYRLKDLLKNCRPEQLHGEVDFGADVGREVLD